MYHSQSQNKRSPRDYCCCLTANATKETGGINELHRPYTVWRVFIAAISETQNDNFVFLCNLRNVSCCADSF